jgi:hypothetical protein
MNKNSLRLMDTPSADTCFHRWRCGRLLRLARLCCKPGEMMGSDKSAATRDGRNTNTSRSNKGNYPLLVVFFCLAEGGLNRV